MDKLDKFSTVVSIINNIVVIIFCLIMIYIFVFKGEELKYALDNLIETLKQQ